jgi:hypothetical protein
VGDWVGARRRWKRPFDFPILSGRESRGLRVELRREHVQESPLVENRSDVSIQPATAEER